MPVYKINNNAVNQQPRPFKPPWVKEDQTPSTPSVPPWRRQQELRGRPGQPPSPGTRTDAPIFPKPQQSKQPESNNSSTTEPAPVRKQSKITIIPSKPTQNGAASILQGPPPLPAPPPDPNLARAPAKPAHEPTKIQVHSKLADRRAQLQQTQQPEPEPPKAKVVPIKIEREPSPPPPPAAPVTRQARRRSPSPTREKPSKVKSPSPPPKQKPAPKPAPAAKKSPSPPPKSKQANNVKPAPNKAETVQTELKVPLNFSRPWLEKSPSPSFWSDRSSSPSPPRSFQTARKQSPDRASSPDIWSRSSTPPPRQCNTPAASQSHESPRRSPGLQRSPRSSLVRQDHLKERSPSPDIWSRSSTPPPNQKSNGFSNKEKSPNIWGNRETTPPPRPIFSMTVARDQSAQSPERSSKENSPDIWGNKEESSPSRSTLYGSVQKSKSPSRETSPDIWGDKEATPPPKPALLEAIKRSLTPERFLKDKSPDFWGDREESPPPRPTFRKTVREQSPTIRVLQKAPQTEQESIHKPKKTKRRKDDAKPKQRHTPTKQKSPPLVVKPTNETSTPAPPPPPPMAPPPPPPPPGFKERKPVVTEVKKARIEALRSRPRRRPDWACMMKELEGGVPLKHVECNDRSKPLIPKYKAKGQFVYESEKRGDNVHNQLLNQIQKGVPLKSVKCNDRSKPMLEGLRKFRRQMTIEEQLIKVESCKSCPKLFDESATDELDSEDDLDDIDKVRDDLQSTKQMLELELREKERLQKDNRRLGARILHLEEDIEKLRKIVDASGQENALVTALRSELEQAKAETARKYAQNQETAKQLAAVRAQLEDAQHRSLVLEKRLEQGGGGGVPPETSSSGTQTIDLQKVSSRRDASIPETLKPELDSDEETEEESEEEITDSESEEESEGEAAAAAERRLNRELKMLVAKLKGIKDKEVTARNERTALKYQLVNLSSALKAEQQKFRALQKEVDKMACIMKEGDDGSEEEEEEEEESEEEEEEETEEEESESEVESEAEDETAAPTVRIEQLGKRNKVHENALAALKKGNYLLKVNIDKMKDDLEKQREKTLALQEDLNAVLAEIG